MCCDRLCLYFLFTEVVSASAVALFLLLLWTLTTEFVGCGQFDTLEVSRVGYFLRSKRLTDYIDKFINILLLFSWKDHSSQAGFERGAGYQSIACPLVWELGLGLISHHVRTELSPNPYSRGGGDDYPKTCRNASEERLCH
jgi:hypothetical protein